MRLSDFDYYLPPDLIAQEPLSERDRSRLLVLNKDSGDIEHKHFHDILDFLKEGDVLVSNNTRVIPARLIGVKENTGGAVEILLLNRLRGDSWKVLVRPGRKVKIGTRLVFGNGELLAAVIDSTPSGERIVEFRYQGFFEEVLERLGRVPLPPYIHKELIEPERYQTVYAVTAGSAAAPTAGLHFTPELIKKIISRGVIWTEVLLHVGLGTFRPVKEDDITRHKMHSEYFEITPETARILNEAKTEGRRIIAVGTTSTRTLESAWTGNHIQPLTGWTEIFIYPGYEFKVISGLITNFHLPKSTLLMLVSALAGREQTLQAYKEAVKEKYRFFSFGDAMLIL